jgi:hypothetical protein
MPTQSNKQIKELKRKGFHYLKSILESPLSSTRALELSETPYGYLGTDNMTEEQLQEHVNILERNYKIMKEETKQ